MKTGVIEVPELLSVLSVDEVEGRIGQVPGVQSVTVNFAMGSATVRYDENRLQIADIKSAVRQHGAYESAARGGASAVAGPEGQTTPGASPATPAPDAPIAASIAPTVAGTTQQDRALPSTSVPTIPRTTPGVPGAATAPALQAPAAATAKPVDTAVPEAAAAAADRPGPPAPPAATVNLPKALPPEAPKSLLQRHRSWIITLVIVVLVAALARRSFGLIDRICISAELHKQVVDIIRIDGLDASNDSVRLGWIVELQLHLVSSGDAGQAAVGRLLCGAVFRGDYFRSGSI